MSHLEGYHAAKSALEWQYEIGIDELHASGSAKSLETWR